MGRQFLVLHMNHQGTSESASWNLEPVLNPEVVDIWLGDLVVLCGHCGQVASFSYKFLKSCNVQHSRTCCCTSLSLARRHTKAVHFNRKPTTFKTFSGYGSTKIPHGSNKHKQKKCMSRSMVKWGSSWCSSSLNIFKYLEKSFHWAIWLFFMILQVSLMWLYRVVILPHSASFPAPGQSHNGDRCAVWTMPFGSGFCCLLGPSPYGNKRVFGPSPYQSESI